MAGLIDLELLECLLATHHQSPNPPQIDPVQGSDWIQVVSSWGDCVAFGNNLLG